MANPLASSGCPDIWIGNKASLFTASVYGVDWGWGCVNSESLRIAIKSVIDK
jgi:hypothetical protein